MITSLYTADVKLNKDGNFVKMLLAENDNGYLFVNRGLFVISFESLEDIEVTNKKHIGDITL